MGGPLHTLLLIKSSSKSIWQCFLGSADHLKALKEPHATKMQSNEILKKKIGKQMDRIQVWKNTINNFWLLFHFKSHKQIPRNLATYCNFFLNSGKERYLLEKVTYSPLLSYSLDGLPLKFFCFFVFFGGNGPVWLVITQTTETWEAPQDKDFFCVRMEWLYMWEGESFGQRIWDKMRCYWEHPWGTNVNLRNIMRNMKNMMGTQE
jgi:hypothetical protein